MGELFFNLEIKQFLSWGVHTFSLYYSLIKKFCSEFGRRYLFLEYRYSKRVFPFVHSSGVSHAIPYPYPSYPKNKTKQKRKKVTPILFIGPIEVTVAVYLAVSALNGKVPGQYSSGFFGDEHSTCDIQVFLLYTCISGLWTWPDKSKGIAADFWTHRKLAHQLHQLHVLGKGKDHENSW